jgi:SAM-dependent methyltransferase
MENPWLTIPADDYIAHMSSPAVAQYQVLNRLFAATLSKTRPRSVLILGCSIGNGLEHIDPVVTSRVVGVDINPVYLQHVSERFQNPGFALDVHCADIAAYAFEHDAFDLVHGALIFEYVEWVEILPRVVAALRRDGVLSVVLQRPSPTSPAVTPTAFSSLQSLEGLFRFVVPEAFVSQANTLGLVVDSRHTEALQNGKWFEVLRLRKSADQGTQSAMIRT